LTVLFYDHPFLPVSKNWGAVIVFNLVKWFSVRHELFNFSSETSVSADASLNLLVVSILYATHVIWGGIFSQKYNELLSKFE